MAQLAFSAENLVTLPISGSELRVPVRKIYCVGKNYHAHAAEMGGTVETEKPFFFLKTPQDVIGSGETIEYPAGTENLHFEVELVAVIHKQLKNATIEEARNAIFGFAVGIDLTRRDLQSELKSKSLPWALAKSFTHSAVIASISTELHSDELEHVPISLSQNGEIKQTGQLGEMVRNCEELLSYLSQLDTVEPGDLLFTGTPAGVSSIAKGDTLVGCIDGLESVSITIAK